MASYSNWLRSPVAQIIRHKRAREEQENSARQLAPPALPPPSPLPAASDALCTGSAATAVPEGAAAKAISTANGDVRIGAGAHVDSIKTVSGEVAVGARAVIKKGIRTVSGGIFVGAGGSVGGNVGAASGPVTLGPGASAKGRVSSVTGEVRLLPGARVAGDAVTANGNIVLDAASVGGNVHSSLGDIEVGAHSAVGGGIRVKRPRLSQAVARPPRVIVGPEATVTGSLVFEHPVELFVHSTARIGEVFGATPVRFTSVFPPLSPPAAIASFESDRQEPAITRPSSRRRPR